MHNDSQNAMADYDHAIKLDPNFMLAYSFRGTLKDYLKDYQGAQFDYDKAKAIAVAK